MVRDQVKDSVLGSITDIKKVQWAVSCPRELKVKSLESI